jgi:hypothetical protein
MPALQSEPLGEIRNPFGLALVIGELQNYYNRPALPAVRLRIKYLIELESTKENHIRETV